MKSRRPAAAELKLKKMLKKIDQQSVASAAFLQDMCMQKHSQLVRSLTNTKTQLSSVWFIILAVNISTSKQAADLPVAVAIVAVKNVGDGAAANNRQQHLQ